MSNAGADIFLILLRPTRVPVAGEAVSHLFQGQVLVESFSWNLHNEDELKRADAEDTKFQKTKGLVERSGSAQLRSRHAWEQAEREQREALKELLDDRRLLADPDDAEARRAADQRFSARMKSINRSHRESIDDIQGIERARTRDEQEEEARQAAVEDAEHNRNFRFTITKRVDIASTQMLNSMKAGDIFPSGTLTIHKRSATVADGTSLVFTIQKIRLIDYQLQVSVTDTMTEMMEEWTCEFGSLAYVYKNPPPHYASGNAGQAVVKTATQGTARAFTMKNIGSPL